MSDDSHAEGVAVESREVGVDALVLVYPGTDREQRGTIVEDFGDMAGYSVDIGDEHFADPARRYAVSLDSGELIFVDAESLVVN
ncbi:MAG: hypothetical protein ACSLE6_15460 [Mycobacterium sp.]|jgi:threonine dehydratase